LNTPTPTIHFINDVSRLVAVNLHFYEGEEIPPSL